MMLAIRGWDRKGPSDVRFRGQKQTCALPLGHVRFASESRHVRRKTSCPLRANSGHSRIRLAMLAFAAANQLLVKNTGARSEGDGHD